MIPTFDPSTGDYEIELTQEDLTILDKKEELKGTFMYSNGKVRKKHTIALSICYKNELMKLKKRVDKDKALGQVFTPLSWCILVVQKKNHHMLYFTTRVGRSFLDLFTDSFDGKIKQGTYNRTTGNCAVLFVRK